MSDVANFFYLPAATQQNVARTLFACTPTVCKEETWANRFLKANMRIEVKAVSLMNFLLLLIIFLYDCLLPIPQ